MKSIIKKFKKLKKIYRIMFFIVNILFLIGIISITQGLLLLKNIETTLRVIFLILTYLSFFIFLFISILLLFTKKNKWYIGCSIFISVLSIIYIILSIYLNKTYNIVDQMNKNTITYSSSLIVLKDTEFKNNSNFKVGMINNESDIEGNILANKLIDKKKIEKISIEYYDNYLEMINDLYSKKINGLFISSNYVYSYSGYENYTNIETETKIVYTYKEEMKNQDILLTTNKSLTEPFTLLILGVDSTKDGLDENTLFNGDTMMLVTFNPNTLNATVFSIPRDTYVPISCNGNTANKINSSAVGGTSCVIKTLNNLTGINIDYYVKINFKGVVDLVDSLNGVDINVPIEFCEQNSNREFGVSEICLTKGQQTLNGEQALALARHRKTLLTGDFERVQNQQLVVEAIAGKAKTIRSVDKFYDVLNAISKNIETNISTDEMLNLYNVGKKMLFDNNTSLNIQKTYLTGYDLTMYIPGLGNVYTFQYYEQSLNEIVKAMKINLELIKPELTKTFNFSVNYKYEIPVIGKEYYTVKRNEAMPNFVGNSIQYLEEWALSRNITINKNYITENMDGYDESKNDIIIYQDVITGTLVSSINNINVNVIKVEKKNEETEKNEDDDNEKNNNNNIPKEEENVENKEPVEDNSNEETEEESDKKESQDEIINNDNINTDEDTNSESTNTDNNLET